jgi:hypothetical protein
MQVWESGCSVTSPSVLGKGKACSSSSRTGELWVNKACRARWGLTHSWDLHKYCLQQQQATAADSHSQICLQTLFFLSPYLWWENNRTTCAWWKTYWHCIAFELGTLCGFFILLFVLFCAVLFYFIFPHWWENYRTTPEPPSPGLEAEGQTTKLLRLKLYCIWTWRFLYIFFIYLFFTFILFIFYIQSSLHLSNAFSAYSWLVHCLSLLISLKLFLFVSLFCFVFLLVICFSLFLYLLCFPSPLTLTLPF